MSKTLAWWCSLHPIDVVLRNVSEPDFLFLFFGGRGESQHGRASHAGRQREGDGPWMEGSQCLLDWFDFEFRGVSLLGS